FGGSSLMVNLIAIGILLNISIFNKIKLSPF
ncbi:cell division protein FtsW, partial [Bacillus thuringiensis]|nr:cell division protein FtsW [Bacillus thuringiensis]